MSVTTVETGTSSQSTANIYNDAISEIKHQRVKRATIDRLDAALEQPMSKEALAVECSTHFTHSKSIIDIRNNMIEATTKARIEEVKSASPAKKYNFNVAKSMKSSGRKNEEEEAHRELKLGALDVWALGIAVVIGGQYFGWNFSLSAGFGSCYIAMLMFGLAYLSLCLCNAGDSP